MRRTLGPATAGAIIATALLIALLVGSNPLLALVRDELHHLCTLAPVTRGAVPEYDCSDGIAYIFVAGIVSGLFLLAVCAALVALAARPSPNQPKTIAVAAAAPPLILVAVTLVVAAGSAATPAGGVWAWPASMGLATALLGAGSLCIAAAGWAEVPQARAATIAGIALFAVAAAVQPGAIGAVFLGAVIAVTGQLVRTQAPAGSPLERRPASPVS